MKTRLISVVLYPQAAAAAICGNRVSEEAGEWRKKGGEEKFPKHLVSRNVKSLAAKKILAIGIRALRARICGRPREGE